MAVITHAQRVSLKSRTEAYHEQLLSPEGHELYEYLTEVRGLTPETIARFQLGAVIEAEEADAPATGMLAIPYLTPTGTVAMRFRRPPSRDGGAGPKYWQPAGSMTTIYNVATFQIGGPLAVICEGELDAMIATQVGLPAVGIPGASAWKPEYRYVFDGFERVIICADNDDQGAGAKFAEKVAEDVPNPSIFLMPEGHDINSLYLAEGGNALREYLKLNPEQKEEAA